MSKIVLAVGGTGGHIFPALEFAKELKDESYFIGVKASDHHLLKGQKGVFSVEGDTLSIRKNLFFALSKIYQGFKESLKLLRSIRPDLVIGFGSYHSLPPLLAAIFLKIPIVLYEPNAKMGRVNRLLFPFAKMIGMHFPGSSKKMRLMSLRSKSKIMGKEEARLSYGLLPDLTTILVFGGSQGAQVLNHIVPFALMGQNVQVIHLLGFKDAPESIQMIYQQHEIRALVKPFEENMESAYLCADLVISRAGAGTLKEIIMYNTPALLIPYPGATDGHQLVNAKYFVEKVGGGSFISQNECSAKKLSQRIQEMLSYLSFYESNLQKYAVGGKGETLSSLVQQFTEQCL
jgi:UDP-N-acetylglucosamine--N-acetylmuramyl-(pentapeptide) pyrophosphoryl-undecaprenol N-acetylglucosamine transferase